jgi:hypothetical protein
MKIYLFWWYLFTLYKRSYFYYSWTPLIYKQISCNDWRIE